MNKRALTLLWILAFGAGFSRSTLVAAQAPAAKRASAAKTGWAVPRTPWGDPDLQGNYTNVYEDGTPLERPDQFAGRTLEDVKGEELAVIKRATEDRTIKQFQTGFDAPDHWWQDALFLEKGSQAWLVVDPPDGKIPPMTPDGQQRVAARAQARQSSGRGPADSYEDRSLYDRCITRGFPHPACRPFTAIRPVSCRARDMWSFSTK